MSDVANVAPKLDEIEITPEMIKAVWGTSISSEDIYDEKERAYVGIFAAMLFVVERSANSADQQSCLQRGDCCEPSTTGIPLNVAI